MFCLSAAPRRWYNNFANLSASSEANLIYSPVGAGEIGLPVDAGGLYLIIRGILRFRFTFDIQFNSDANIDNPPDTKKANGEKI